MTHQQSQDNTTQDNTIQFKRMAELTNDQSLAVMVEGHQTPMKMVNYMNADAMVIPAFKRRRGAAAEGVLIEWQQLRNVPLLKPGNMTLTVVDLIENNAIMQHWHLIVTANR